MHKPPKIGGGGADDAAGDPWVALRQSTAARIGLARTGASLATAPLLDFRLAYARARDAVHAPLDEAKLLADLSVLWLPVHAVSSAVADRAQYLCAPTSAGALPRPSWRRLRRGRRLMTSYSQ